MKREITKTLNKKRKGFTLVELIAVIAILAVLSVGAITGYSNVRAGAEKAVNKSNAAVIANTLNTYNMLASDSHKIEIDTNVTDDKLAALVLTTSGANADLVDMNLSIDTTGIDIAEAKAYLFYYNNKWGVYDTDPNPAGP